MKISDIRESVLRPDEDHERYTGKANDLEDPEVLVPGYGGLKLSSVKRLLAERCQDLAERCANGEWEIAKAYLNNGVLAAFSKTIVDAEKELEDSRSATDSVISKASKKKR